MRLNRKFWAFFILCLALAGCSPAAHTLSGTPTRTNTIEPSAPIETITPTYPCPMPTQEVPPRVEPLISPTQELTQVVHILPGNYQTATIETESGTFTADFKGAQGAPVQISLLPNTTHHLKVTVHIRRVTFASGCSYGGYDMTVFADRTGNPLEIVQGLPPAPVPVTQTLGPDSLGSLRLLARISLPDRLRPWSAFFSLDDRLYTYGFGQGVRTWQPLSGSPAGNRMLSESDMTSAASLSPDQNMLATGAAGYSQVDENQTSVRLWDLKYEKIQLLGHQPNSVECLAFNPSGTLLASGGNDNTVIIWDTATGKETARFNGDIVKLADGSSLIQGMRKLIWVDDQTLIGRADAVIYEWKVPSGERLREITGNYLDMDFSRPAGLLAVVRPDGVYLQDPISGTLINLLENDQKSLDYRQVNFNPDGTILAAVNAQKISFWNTRTKQLLGSGKNPAGVPVVFSPDWLYLARVNWEEQYVSTWGVQP